MVQRILATALFSFAVLALSASQLRADADGMNSVYSATECKVDVEATPDGVAQYNTMYNRGGIMPPNLKGITNTSPDHKLKVNCPLPVLDLEMDPMGMDPMDMDSVVVTIVDGTTQGSVACRLVACTGGVGTGGAGTTGSCAVSQWRSSSASNAADGYTPIVPPGSWGNHVSHDINFLTFNYHTGLGKINDISKFAADVAMMKEGLGASSNLSHPGLNLIDFSLECSIPAQDVNQEMIGISTYGYSYIQSYAVMNMDMDMDM